MLSPYTFIKGSSPIVSTAIHYGHLTRKELDELFNLDEDERLREEDPFTAQWLNVSDNKIIMHHSRFEVDVNRPRPKAVYQLPEDAWGLNVWKNKLPETIVNTSLKLYDDFYQSCKIYFDQLFTQHPKIIVYDIHSYNHQREGIIADAILNPEINLGTKNMDRKLWEPVIEALSHHFNNTVYGERKFDARENIKFKGGYFGQWLFENYGKNICPISIEFKKFFMDEITGKPFEKEIQHINQLLKSSQQLVLAALKEVEK